MADPGAQVGSRPGSSGLSAQANNFDANDWNLAQVLHVRLQTLAETMQVLSYKINNHDAVCVP